MWSFNVAKITEVAPAALVPNIILQKRVLRPFRYQTGGSVLAGKLAMERGWSINIGGGFHHCWGAEGGGFCAYADITLTVHFLLSHYPAVQRVMIIDLDAHQLGKAVVYTDSLSSLHLLLSGHPRSSTSLVHTIQRALHLTNEGWEIAFQWVPSHAGIPGNEVADSATRMALTEVNTTPFPLPLSTATRLISRVCRSTWNNMLGDALRITSMGQYRSDSSPQPWIRKKSRVLDVTLTRLRLGHTRLTAHLHRLCLSPDPHCPWCMNIPETIEHFLLQCPRFHSHRVVLQSQLLALNVTTFDLPTLLAAAGGNGHERDFMGRKDIYILDMYNKYIYPHDSHAKKAISRQVELFAYTEDEEYLDKVTTHVEGALNEFSPQVVIYNAGTDIMAGDCLGLLSVTKQGIIERDEIVFRKVTQKGVPIVMLTSGGYQRSTAAVIADSIVNLSKKSLIDM
ncbi:Histone deacetylase 11 [Chionoecetes opilio]|uniref:Histone deacetylase 11 n=1 Tax=Chionoecetes opilio TaxID=41210 RepID=A0A8J8WF09_CHIOP|nr:Histone deacetylase 11 [Chionoecetes opilio]